MLKLTALGLSANLFISTFYQLKPFCVKVSDGTSAVELTIYGLGFVLLILNLLTTFSMFLLVNEIYSKVVPAKIISTSTLGLTFIFLVSFFDNHFTDCLLLSLPLLIINGLVIVFAFSHKEKQKVVSR